MDKSALKDKRRETVIGLLKGMNIKKDSDGGFDKDDVYGCIQELCNLYEEHIDELENNYEAEISELTKRYQKYDENNELYVSLILEAKKSSNEIINQAKTEVDEILRNGKEKIQEQEEQMEQFRIDSEKERDSVLADLKASKEVADAEKAAMKVELEAEKEKLEATKNKYRQQVAAMEDEFAEIRTNILRTSARLDSLKAQTEEMAPSVDWEVDEDETAVEVPTADIEVDEFAEIELPEEPVEAPAEEPVVFEEPVIEELPEEPVEVAAEEPVEAPAEEAAPAEDLFADAFFKDELFADAPKEEGNVAAIEEALAEAPAEAAEAAPAVEHEATVEELLASMDALADDLPTEDLGEKAAGAAEDVDAMLDEISFDDLIDEGAAKATETVAEAAPAEEISFDSLEALFKNEQ